MFRAAGWAAMQPAVHFAVFIWTPRRTLRAAPPRSIFGGLTRPTRAIRDQDARGVALSRAIPPTAAVGRARGAHAPRLERCLRHILLFSDTHCSFRWLKREFYLKSVMRVDFWLQRVHEFVVNPSLAPCQVWRVQAESHRSKCNFRFHFSFFMLSSFPYTSWLVLLILFAALFVCREVGAEGTVHCSFKV